MKKPKISVILPVYNGEKYLKESIKSILNQTFINFELIIINDGSIDNTQKIANSFKDKRIKIIQNKKNIGITNSLNIGLKHARGEYIARTDSDDISLKKRFQSQVNFLDTHTDFVLVGANCQWIDSRGKPLNGFKVAIEDSKIRKMMYIRNQFHHPSVMFRQNVLKKTGKYRQLFNGVEDYDLWFRILSKGKGYNFSENLIKRRFHKEAISQKKHFKIELLAIFVRLINIKRLW